MQAEQEDQIRQAEKYHQGKEQGDRERDIEVI